MIEEKPEKAQTPPTEEEIKDYQNRVKSCNAEIIPILEKYGLLIGSHPLLTPDGRVTSQWLFVNDTRTKEEKVEPKSDSKLSEA